jgi:hypothetical protein
MILFQFHLLCYGKRGWLMSFISMLDLLNVESPLLYFV